MKPFKNKIEQFLWNQFICIKQLANIKSGYDNILYCIYTFIGLWKAQNPIFSMCSKKVLQMLKWLKDKNVKEENHNNRRCTALTFGQPATQG